MLSPSWSIKLPEQPLYSTIIQNPRPSIIYQGISNQLMVMSQNNQSLALPIRKQILHLSSLPTNQILLLTRYNLICYDLTNNNELFIKQFENAERLHVSNKYIYVLCGGDVCCFTFQGEQQYINHLGNSITAIQTYDSIMGEQVIVALDDMSMKRYKGVNIVFDYSKVVGLVNTICWIEGGAMVGTQQGTIAFYQSKKSKWKAKSTHSTYKIINWTHKEKDNVLVIRKNGSIEIRDHKKGQTINKLKIGEPFVALHLSDFRSQLIMQLLIVCKSGTVKAFNLQQEGQIPVVGPQKLIGDQQHGQIKKYDQLLKEKAQLEYEINQLERLCNQQQSNNVVNQQNALGADFKIEATMRYEKGLFLIITCTNGFISGLSFQQPIMPYRAERSQKMKYFFRNQNKIAGQITCQALCHSSFSSKSYEIRNFKINLSKFWQWGYIPQKVTEKQIQGSVKFDLIQRNARYIKWMQQCFFFNVDEATVAKMEANQNLSVRFYNFYEQKEMEIAFKSKEGKVQIKCDSVQVLGEIIQDLMEYVGAKQLDSVLCFPQKQKSKLKQVMNNIEKLSQTKIAINSEMAEAVNVIKFLLVKGQSSLAVGNLKQLRKSYNQIMNQNKSILVELQKKNSNTQSLSDSMKILGKFINQTSNVRFGKAKQTIINQCRQAIKNKNFPKILSIMERGLTATV